MSSTTGSAGSNATLTNPYDNKTNSKDRAFDILIIMLEAAASRSLSDHVKLDPAPIMLVEADVVGAGATIASRAQYEID